MNINDKIEIKSNNIKYTKAAKSAILYFHYLVKNGRLAKSTLDSFDIDYEVLDHVAELVRNAPADEMEIVNPANEMEIVNKVLKEIAIKDSTFLYDICENVIHIYTTNTNYWEGFNDILMYGKARRVLKDEYGLDYKIVVHEVVLPE